MKLYIDIGGTNLRSELHGDSIHKEILSSNDNDLITFIDSKITAYPQISFVGISYAGQVNNGEILSAPNIVVSEKKIKAYFESRYALRLEIDNDLNCAVMAEAAYYKSNSIAALYVGTGIGSAVIDNGRIIRGHANQAFEIGHIPYKEAPFECGCGKRNCLELFVSGSAIEKWIRYNHNSEESDLQRLRSSSDEKSRMIVNNFEKALLHGAATLITLANPKVLVLGGGVIEHNRYLVALLEEKVGDYALAASLQGLEIKESKLQNAGIDGAKLLEERHYG